MIIIHTTIIWYAGNVTKLNLISVASLNVAAHLLNFLMRFVQSFTSLLQNTCGLHK